MHLVVKGYKSGLSGHNPFLDCFKGAIQDVKRRRVGHANGKEKKRGGTSRENYSPDLCARTIERTHMKKTLFLLLVLMVHHGFGQSNAKRVLFIGNSYTFYNDMPELVKSCALSTGDTLTTDQSTISGYTWRQHSTNEVTNNKIKQGGFDHVVLQANSLEFTYDDNTVNTGTLPYGRYLDSLAHKYNPCAQTIFYNTWGRKNGSNGQTYLRQDTLIEQRYKAFANARTAMVSPVGPVRRYLRTNNPSIELYISDESHPTLAGSFVSAVCFYTVIFRKDPTLMTYKPTDLSTADANAIKQAVKLILFNDFAKWNVGAYDPAAPVANFNVATVSETNVAFTNTSQNAASYGWQFGDNTHSSASSPSHIFPQSGTYQVKLTASYCKLKSSVTKAVTVSSVKPIISGVKLTPAYVYPSDNATISATITDNTGIANATLYWGTTSATVTTLVTMTAIGNSYSAQIPAQAANTTIYYKIVATDISSLVTTSETFGYVVQDAVITLDPATITVYRNDQVQFTASATNTTGNPIAFAPSWTADAGFITAAGLYIAPYEPGVYTITAKQAGVNGTGLAYVTVSDIPVIAGKVEAENFTGMSGIQMEATEDASGGKDVAYIDANDWMTYKVNVLKTGKYLAEFRVAANVANTRMELMTGTTSVGILTIPNATGGWQSWQTFSMNIELTEGIQVLRFVARTAGFNLNWMKFTLVEEPPVTGVNEFASAENMVTAIAPNPFMGSTKISLDAEGTKQIQLLNAQGIQIARFETMKNILELGEELPAGIYQVKISCDGKAQVVRLVKQ